MKKIILIALSLPFLSACSPSMLKMPELPTLTDASESQPSETDTLEKKRIIKAKEEIVA